jgi:hypothetical protein
MAPADDFHALVKTVYAFTYPSFVRKVLGPALVENAAKCWNEELAADWAKWCKDEKVGRTRLVEFGRGRPTSDQGRGSSSVLRGETDLAMGYKTKDGTAFHTKENCGSAKNMILCALPLNPRWCRNYGDCAKGL